MSRAAVLRERWALNLPLKMGFKLMLFFVLLCSFLTKKKKKDWKVENTVNSPSIKITLNFSRKRKPSQGGWITRNFQILSRQKNGPQTQGG